MENLYARKARTDLRVSKKTTTEEDNLICGRAADAVLKKDAVAGFER